MRWMLIAGVLLFGGCEVLDYEPYCDYWYDVEARGTVEVVAEVDPADYTSVSIGISTGDSEWSPGLVERVPLEEVEFPHDFSVVAEFANPPDRVVVRAYLTPAPIFTNPIGGVLVEIESRDDQCRYSFEQLELVIESPPEPCPACSPR